MLANAHLNQKMQVDQNLVEVDSSPYVLLVNHHPHGLLKNFGR